jgi:hypothetical protein
MSFYDKKRYARVLFSFLMIKKINMSQIVRCIVSQVFFPVRLISKRKSTKHLFFLKGKPPRSEIVFRYLWSDLAEMFSHYVCRVNLISCKFFTHKVFVLKSY